MQTFLMMTRLEPASLRSPRALEDLERDVMRHVRADCPGIEWKGSYAVTGPYDYIDVFSAPDFDSALQVSAIVRTFGHAHTELWAATEWDHFKKLMHELPAGRDRVAAAAH